MKRWFLLFLLLAVLLSGCQGQGTEHTEVPPVSQQDSTQESTQESQDIPEAPTAAVSLMEHKQPIGNDEVLWYLPNETIEQLQWPQLQVDGDRLLVSAYTDMTMNRCTFLLQSLDAATGMLQAEARLSCSGYVTMQISQKGIGICDEAMGKVSVLDAQLNLIGEYPVKHNSGSWYLGKDLDTLYIIDYEKGIFKYTLSTRTEAPLLTDSRNVCFLGSNPRELFLSYTDMTDQRNKYLRIDLETGALSDLSTERNIAEVFSCDDTLLYHDYNQWNTYYLSAPGQPEAVVHLSEQLTLLAPYGCLLKENWEINQLSLYQTDGTFLSCFTLPQSEGTLWEQPVWSDTWKGYFFISIQEDQTGRLMFWDTSVPCQGDGLAMQNTEDFLAGGIAAAPELYQRAEELSRKHNVEILIADQCQLDYSHYTSFEVYDTSTISQALDELEDALSVYPEGFFSQLCYGNIRRIQIELVGGLSAKEGSGMGSAAAFTQEQPDYYLLVSDVYTTCSVSYYHEFTHILDNRLAWDASLRTDALFSEDTWAALQPEGFQYALSYLEMPESTLQYVNSGYFISDYSCTFPTEDRATMMETAMTQDSYYFRNHPGLQAKLDYYCRCIRDCLDTSGWPEATIWEKMLSY